MPGLWLAPSGNLPIEIVILPGADLAEAEGRLPMICPKRTRRRPTNQNYRILRHNSTGINLDTNGLPNRSQRTSARARAFRIYF